jgi:hypothetical protein
MDVRFCQVQEPRKTGKPESAGLKISLILATYILCLRSRQLKGSDSNQLGHSYGTPVDKQRFQSFGNTAVIILSRYGRYYPNSY